MTPGDDTSTGQTRAEITTAIARLQTAYYGQGPIKAKTYITDDLVVVVLEETFTKAERTLIARGETDAIKHIRRRFQQTMADDFTSIVEQATGRVVRAFLSETDVNTDISVELFLLGPPRTDMANYETTRPPSRPPH